MGLFSWIDCSSGEPLQTYVTRDTYLLIPKEFYGITVSPYAGPDADPRRICTNYFVQGCCGGVDAYDAAADWNREWISKHPEFCPEDLRGKPISSLRWYADYADLSLTRKDVLKKHDWLEWREIGITFACYDLDAARIPYPIKLTRSKDVLYEDCPYSLGDPFQGCEDRFTATEKKKMDAWRKSVDAAVRKTGVTALPVPRRRYPL